mmetsp:Transcript_12404/g.35487  ORF Transcript_12404/g.35487 Transcript_12404/m.35487 type:complete len:247 (+) Transcript_12404:687-1427(+)
MPLIVAMPNFCPRVSTPKIISDGIDADKNDGLCNTTATSRPKPSYCPSALMMSVIVIGLVCWLKLAIPFSSISLSIGMSPKYIGMNPNTHTLMSTKPFTRQDVESATMKLSPAKPKFSTTSTRNVVVMSSSICWKGAMRMSGIEIKPIRVCSSSECLMCAHTEVCFIFAMAEQGNGVGATQPETFGCKTLEPFMTPISIVSKCMPMLSMTNSAILRDTGPVMKKRTTATATAHKTHGLHTRCNQIL